MLADRYELLEDLGSGGMATVWRARDRRLGREVAVKVLSPSLASDPAFRDRFDREARHVASLTHPNIVTVHDSGSEGDSYYMVMELVRGESLESKLASTSPYMSLEDTLRIARGVLAALARAHSRGVVHRDIKPGNILVTPDGTAKVADFGIAKGFTEFDALTGAGTFMGTLFYASPEQLEGRPATPASDLYSFGCVLYECLVGHPPFEAELSAGVVAQHLQASPRPLRPQRPEIPAHVEAAVLRAMQKDPDQRFSTAAEMSEAFGAIDTKPGKPVPSLPTVVGSVGTETIAREVAEAGRAPVPEPEVERGRWRQRWPVLAAVGALVVAAAIVLPLVLLGGGRSSSSAAEDANQPADCIADHHLSGPHQMITPFESQTIFASCEWPAPSYADREGFSAITVVSTFGPDGEPASGLNRADIIASSCRALKLGYQLNAKGAVTAIPPFEARLGEIVSVLGAFNGPWDGDPSTLPFHPSPNQVVVLRNSHDAITSASCIT
jgi:serine/threonine-protein kinase